MNHDFQPRKYLFAFCCLCIPFLVSAHGVSPSDQQVLSEGGLLSYIYVGAKHMITGYDHILFLVGVIFMLNTIKEVVQLVSAFTIGHSITLISATLGGVMVDEHLIDAVIALSVVYKGFENLGGFEKIFNTKAPGLLMMVVIFGLIHGFGLSTRLQQFDIGTDQILAKIISFNIGVELGQVLALLPIILLIQLWRKNWRGYATFKTITNWGLVIIGIGLFIFQLFGYFSHAH